MRFMSPYHRARLLLATAGVLACALFIQGARWLGVPDSPGFGGSLLIAGGVAASLALALGAGALSALIGTLLAGRIRFNAGLFVAAIGLCALSVRGGPSRQTWLTAQITLAPSGIFLRMALETLLLGLLLAAIWWTLRWLHGAGILKDRESEDMLDTPGHLAATEATAAGVQLGVTALAMLLLSQSDGKSHTLAAMFFASFAGSAAAHTLYHTGPRSWYWLPPLVLGTVAYLVASFSPPEGLAIANPTGYLAPLIRPLPLDYAGAGVAGAVAGHWMSRRWLKERKEAADAEAANTAGEAA